MHMIECSPKGLWLGNVATFNWSSLVHCWVFHVAGEVPVWVGSPERERILLRGSDLWAWDRGCSQTSGESMSLASSLWRKNRHMETSMDVNNSLFIGTWEHIKIGGPSANGIMPLGLLEGMILPNPDWNKKRVMYVYWDNTYVQGNVQGVGVSPN